RLLEDGAICGIKIGEPTVLQVPLAFFVDGEVVKPLKGTLSTLHDAGFDDEEAIVWLFTPDDSLPGRPIDLLRVGNRKEVRRRAQALAFRRTRAVGSPCMLSDPAGGLSWCGSSAPSRTP